jgi:hypothetical protein
MLPCTAHTTLQPRHAMLLPHPCLSDLMPPDASCCHTTVLLLLLLLLLYLNQQPTLPMRSLTVPKPRALRSWYVSASEPMIPAFLL